MANKRKNNIYILFTALGLIVVAFYYIRYQTAPDITQGDLKILNDAGDTLQLDDFEGKTVFINFFASWCGPCMQEMPDLQKAWENKSKGNKEIMFIGVSDDPWSKINDVQGRFNISFPLYKISGDLRSNGIYTIPTSYLIDKDGIVLKKTTGTINPLEWIEGK